MPSRWDDRFDQHNVWDAVRRYTELIEQVPEAYDGGELASVDRLNSVLELLKEHQEKGRKELYSTSSLNEVESAIRNSIEPLLSTFVNNPESSVELDTAADGCDAVLDTLRKWPALPVGNQAVAAGRAIADYRRAATDGLNSFSARRDEIDTEIASLRTKLTEIESSASAFVDKYSEALVDQEAQFNDAIGRVEQSGGDAYDKAIVKELNSRTQELGAYIERAAEEAEKAERSAEAAAKFEESSKDSADFIAKKAIATDFGRQARRKTLAGVLYEVAGIAIGGGTIIMLLRHYLSDSNTGDNVLALGLARFSVTVGLFVIAGYLLSRGASSHKQARASKSADIRFQTLEAFISQLAEEDQDEIRMGMARNIFLHGRLADDEADGTWGFMSALRGKPEDKKADPKPEET